MSDLVTCPKCGAMLEEHNVYQQGRDLHDGRMLRARACPTHGAFGMRDNRVVPVDPVADPTDF